MYIECNDKVIYLIVKNFLIAVEDVFWDKAKPESFIIKTVGILALLDILRKLCGDAINAKDISVEYFANRLAGAKDVDFGSTIFQNASGSGRTKIRKCIEIHIGILSVEYLKPDGNCQCSCRLDG